MIFLNKRSDVQSLCNVPHLCKINSSNSNSSNSSTSNSSTGNSSTSNSSTSITSISISCIIYQVNMGWDDTWNDIASGGPLRWKVTDPSHHQIALSHMERYFCATGPSGDGSRIEPGGMTEDDDDDDGPAAKRTILCPLAGDDPLVHLLWQRGHDVTAIDMVPVALERMRGQFSPEDGGQWTQSAPAPSGTGGGDGDTVVVWTHSSGRATQYVGDALIVRPELKHRFDAVYDKDSFGALPVELRQAYCARLADYTKPGAIVYIEVKLRDDHNESRDVVGPPFSLNRDDLMRPNNFGGDFDYVANLGVVYPSAPSFSTMKQIGHVMIRL